MKLNLASMLASVSLAALLSSGCLAAAYSGAVVVAAAPQALAVSATTGVVAVTYEKAVKKELPAYRTPRELLLLPPSPLLLSAVLLTATAQAAHAAEHDRRERQAVEAPVCPPLVAPAEPAAEARVVQLTGHAHRAACEQRCSTVKALGRIVARGNAGYHREVFVADPTIAACLK
jgi:hypothetical protein